MHDDVPPRLDFENAERRSFLVEEGGERLDVWLAVRLGETRGAVQRLLKAGAVRVGGAAARAASRVNSGDLVEVDVPRVLPPIAAPEDLPLSVLLEDESFAAVDKAPGMAVHPGRGRAGGTVANALAFRYPSLSRAGGAYRPGIVHRLDLETSGVLVVAKTEAAHAALAEAFKSRVVRKTYDAIVFGEPAWDARTVDLPLGRDLHRRERMAVRHGGGREAVTGVEVVERFPGAAYVRCSPRTGRTHQIRVHLAAEGHPLLGDATYAGRREPPVPVPRLMLHARRLAFPHPRTGEEVEVEAPLPADFRAVLRDLRAI